MASTRIADRQTFYDEQERRAMNGEDDIGYQVELFVYDLSKGLAKTMSPALLGKQIEGIWHTGVVAYGREYFFGSEGITSCRPGGTILGDPDRVEELGESQVPYQLFLEYIFGLGEAAYKPGVYDLLKHNCNNFSDEVSQFLCGHGIPKHILQLPDEVLNTPLGETLSGIVNNLDIKSTGSRKINFANYNNNNLHTLAPTTHQTHYDDSPDLELERLNQAIDQVRQNTQRLEDRRNSINEKVNKRDKKKKEKREKRERKEKKKKKKSKSTCDLAEGGGGGGGEEGGGGGEEEEGRREHSHSHSPSTPSTSSRPPLPPPTEERKPPLPPTTQPRQPSPSTSSTCSTTLPPPPGQEGAAHLPTPPPTSPPELRVSPAKEEEEAEEEVGAQGGEEPKEEAAEEEKQEEKKEETKNQKTVRWKEEKKEEKEEEEERKEEEQETEERSDLQATSEEAQEPMADQEQAPSPPPEEEVMEGGQEVEEEGVRGPSPPLAAPPVEEVEREPPIVFKDDVNARESWECLAAACGSLLSGEEKTHLEELRAYVLDDEGSWALGENFSTLLGRVLHDGAVPDEARVHLVRLMAAAALKDDVILLLHQDRRDHTIMNYANKVESLGPDHQEALALFFCNMFEHVSPSEWLLYISEWQDGSQATSNIRVTTKVAVNALLNTNPKCQEYGSAIMYNLGTKEVKTVVFDDVAPELAMAILQFFNSHPDEELLWRAMAALCRFTYSSTEVPALIKMIGPEPSTFRGASERVDALIDEIDAKLSRVRLF